MGGRKTPRGISVTADGTIQVAFTWKGTQCRERLRLKPTPANLAYASRMRTAVLLEIERGTFVYAQHFPRSMRARDVNPAQTVGDLLDAYLSWAERNVAHSTYLGYSRGVNYHLHPEFGALPITALTTAAVKKWIGSLAVSAKRINNVLIPLRHITADAYSDGLIPSDPMKRVPHLKDRRSKVEPDPFSADDVAALIGAARTPEFSAFIRFAVATGLRTSELMALCWTDVDWKAGTVRVERAFVEGRLSQTTKTESGIRDVLLMPMALEALKDMRPISELAHSQIFIYPPRGRPFEGYDEIRKQWQPTIRRAKIRYRPQYQTRHTYASWLLSAGENPIWVAQQMGHRDWGMIRRVYGRWIDSASPGAGDRGRVIFTTLDSQDIHRVTKKPAV